LRSITTLKTHQAHEVKGQSRRDREEDFNFEQNKKRFEMTPRKILTSCQTTGRNGEREGADSETSLPGWLGDG